MERYDIVTVGGGLGGSALAKAMAERGARVLVVERDTHFKDRVRGEALAPWGQGEARNLGIGDLLGGCGNTARYWDVYFGSTRMIRRDLVATTPQKAGWLCFFHPAMQDLMIEAAAKAGAEVRRGAHVRHVMPGKSPTATVEQGGKSEEVGARLVVGCDGRGSVVRQWGGFVAKHDPDRLYLAGLLFDGMPLDPEIFYNVMTPGQGLLCYLFPQGKGRVRAYFGHHRDTFPKRLQGAHDVQRFQEASKSIGLPAELFEGAKPAGPLATFAGADSWVDHPYQNGVALVGDAAATSDQTWGQGLSLTLRDVRVLRDCLLETDDWDRGAHAYAEQHDWHYDVIRKSDGWLAQIFMEIGPEADVIRARALPRIAEDPTRIPDCGLCGPEVPADEAARRRWFGED